MQEGLKIKDISQILQGKQGEQFIVDIKYTSIWDHVEDRKFIRLMESEMNLESWRKCLFLFNKINKQNQRTMLCSLRELYF